MRRFRPRAARESELAEELRAHLDMAVRDRVARGADPREAERAARREFGNLLHVSEVTREQWGGIRLERLRREVHQALRSLRRTPRFTVTAVVVLGLGVGLATTMFAVAGAILVRPLPARAPDEVVLPRTLDPGGVDVGLSRDEIRELTSSSRTLSAAAGVAHQGAFTMTLLDGERVLNLAEAWVTGNFFEVLGVRPVIGRLFVAKDEVPTGTKSSPIVLSYDTWQRQFGGDSGVIGRHLKTPYSDAASTIIGVAPPGLAWPPGTALWSPVAYTSIDVIARLAPGATPEMARQEFFAIVQRFDSVRAATGMQAAHIVRASIETLRHAILGDVRPRLLVLTAGVVLLLLIACVNVGNLVLLRATARQPEVALRRSLGAGTADVIRPLLWESVALACGGGLVGVLATRVLLAAATWMAPPEVPRIDVLRAVTTPIALAAGVTLLTLLLATVLPALIAVRSDIGAPLRLGARTGHGTHRRRRLRHLLVAAQVALALLMVASAGLFARSLERLVRIPLGYRADGLAFLTMARPTAPGNAMELLGALYERVAPAWRAIPGVATLSPIAVGPFYGPQVFTARWAAAGQSDADARANPLIPFEVGGADYFRTFEIPLYRGRGFRDSDVAGAPHVVVVSRAVARRFWPGEDPVGKQLRLVGDTSADPWMTVVGEAGDIRFRTLRSATPTIYVPWRQLFFQGVVAVRYTGNLQVGLPAFRRALRDADPSAVMARAESMDELLSRQRALARFSTTLLTAFGLAALLLTAIGVHGVMSAALRERAPELGIRAALGASPAQLRQAVLRPAAIMTLAGAAAGVGGAIALTRFLQSLLFEVLPTDPLTLAGACAVLFAAAALAAWGPAWRATRVDPVRTLRAD